MSINKRQIGNLGESLAVEFLKKKKYKILERNFYTPLGEIDVVAKQKKQLIFVEVKMNQKNEFGLPEERFDYHKKRKLLKAVRAYLLEHKIKDDNWRIDLVAINAANPVSPEIRHYSGIDLSIKNY
jgi:putative endonuclease